MSDAIGRRILGRQGLSVSAIGLGCMGMSDFYGPADEATNLAVLNHALDIGVNFLDSADMYGVGRNEELLAKVLRTRRQAVVVATKFGQVRAPDGAHLGIDGRPEYVAAACDASLKRLGVEHIDLYYQHRVDPKVPIEETVGAMARLVAAGKVRYLGLCEVSGKTLRRAAGVHPIAAVQSEYSLWSRDPEGEILAVTRELGIAFVPYSPLGRGFLTGKIKTPEDLEADDWRRSTPRFQGENLQKNLDLVTQIQRIAKEKGCTPGQLALTWVLARGDDIVPIPGTKRRKFLEENIGAARVTLTAQELAEIDRILPAAAGERYPSEGMRALNL